MPLMIKYAIFSMLMVCCCRAYASNQPSPNLQSDSQSARDFINQLHNWRTRIVNVSLRWKQVSRDEVLFGGNVVPEDKLDGFYTLGDFAWEETGSMKIDIQTFRNNKCASRETWGWSKGDAIQYHAKYKISNEEPVPDRIVISQMTSDRARSTVGVMPLMGCFDTNKSMWFTEILKESHVVKVDSDVVACDIYGQQIELDRLHGNMPKRVVHQNSVFEVKTHYELPAEIWLPKEGTYTRVELEKPVVVNWEVFDVKVNQNLHPEVFQPPSAIKGTLIDNRITGKLQRHDFSHWERMNEIAEIAKVGAPSYANTYSSRTTSWWLKRGGLAILIAVSLIFFAQKCHSIYFRKG